MADKNYFSKDGFDYLQGLTVPDTRTKPTTQQEDPWLTFLNSQLNNLSTTSPGSYLGQAGNLLGELDLSAFDELRSALNASYETNKSALESSYDNLMENLGKQQTQNSQNFAQSRATISENAFGRGRDLYRNLAARGLGASGLQQLGDVQNRMATGREVSGAAGQYYDTSEKIADTKEQGTESYNTQLQQLSNNLQSALASISQQEIQYKNEYQRQLADIAFQLQESAINQQNLRYNLEAELAKYQSDSFNEDKVKNSESAKLELVSQDIPTEMKIRQWMDAYGVSYDVAKSEVETYTKDLEENLYNEATGDITSWVKEYFASEENKGLFGGKYYNNGDGSTDFQGAFQVLQNNQSFWEKINDLYDSVGWDKTYTYIRDNFFGGKTPKTWNGSDAITNWLKSRGMGTK